MGRSTEKVLAELLRDGTGLYGLEIARNTNVSTSRVYRILNHLTQEGWVDVRTETTNARDYKRPPRKTYVLTKKGREKSERPISKVLRALSLHGELYELEIAAATQLDRRVVSTVVKELEQRGHITVRTAPSNRNTPQRRKYVKLA